MIWIIGLLMVVICVVLLVLRGIKGPEHTLESLERPIKDLLNRGYDNAFLIINISHSKNFLQLKKYIKEPGEYGIRLCFPNARWSNKFFKKLIIFCDRKAINYTITEENANEPLTFLIIDFTKDVEKANRYVKEILLEIFEVDKNVKLFVRLENAAIENKLIDR
jgi:hypothetical protein